MAKWCMSAFAPFPLEAVTPQLGDDIEQFEPRAVIFCPADRGSVSAAFTGAHQENVLIAAFGEMLPEALPECLFIQKTQSFGAESAFHGFRLC